MLLVGYWWKEHVEARIPELLESLTYIDQCANANSKMFQRLSHSRIVNGRDVEAVRKRHISWEAYKNQMEPKIAQSSLRLSLTVLDLKGADNAFHFRISCHPTIYSSILYARCCSNRSNLDCVYHPCQHRGRWLWHYFSPRTLIQLIASGYTMVREIRSNSLPVSEKLDLHSIYDPNRSRFVTQRPHAIKLIVDLITTSGLFDYTFTGFVDQTSNSTFGGMQYSNTAFRDCFVQGLYLSQDLDGLNSQVRNPSSSCLFSMV